MSEPAPSIPHMLADAVDEAPDAEQLLVKRYGRWTTLSRREVLSRSVELALGLREAGLERGEVVAMALRPTTDRVVADIALQLVGAIAVGVPTGMPEDQVRHVLADSGASWVMVQNQHLADLVLPMAEGGAAPAIVRILYVDGAGVEDYASPLLAPVTEVVSAGARAASGDDAVTSRLLDAIDPDAPVALNYSSGVTGMPRGVLLTHRNLVATTNATVAALDLGPTDRVLSFRPLSDPVERGATLYPSLVSGAVLALPESRATVESAMWEIAPTYIHLTPRYIRTIADGIRVRLLAARNLKRLVARGWLSRVRRALEDGDPPSPSGLDRFLVGRPVLEKLGLDQVRHVVVSGSRISTEALDFFAALGLTIRPAYSLTEVGGFGAMPRGAAIPRETLGTTMPGLESRVVDGELHLRGAAVTTHALGPDGPVRLTDEDGWLPTGDAAEERDDGLVVRGRLGDMSTTTTGRTVNLTEIEAALVASPYLREAVLTDRGQGLVLTIEPEFEGVGRWATAHDIDYSTDRSLLALPEVHDLLERAVDAVLQDVDGLRIARTEVLTLPLTVADGTLTLNDKVRRHAVRSRPTIDGPTDAAELLVADTRGTTGAR